MDTLSAVHALKSEKELLPCLLAHAEEVRAPIALWRLPGSNLKHLIISEHYRPLEEDEVLENLEPGLIMAPFDTNKKRLSLAGNIFLTFENGLLKTDEACLDGSTAQWLREQMPARVLKSHVAPTTNPTAVRGTDQSKESFIGIVKKGLQQIEKGTLEKIVPSRRKTVMLP